jgi:NADH dehydrogenase FAD-containing subunit
MSNNPAFKVIMVTPTPWFENKPVLVRQLVDPSIDAAIAVAQEMVKHTTYLPPENLVIGEVKDLTNDRIILEDETLEYDYCVVTTGCEYNIADGIGYTSAGLNKLALKLKNSKRVVVVGGGTIISNYGPIHSIC